MKIKVLENFRHGRDEFVADDVRTVSDELGAYFCRAGWAEDIAGQVKTQPRDPHRRVVLEMGKATHGNATQEAG